MNGAQPCRRVEWGTCRCQWTVVSGREWHVEASAPGVGFVDSHGGLVAWTPPDSRSGDRRYAMEQIRFLPVRDLVIRGLAQVAEGVEPVVAQGDGDKCAQGREDEQAKGENLHGAGAALEPEGGAPGNGAEAGELDADVVVAASVESEF